MTLTRRHFLQHATASATIAGLAPELSAAGAATHITQLPALALSSAIKGGQVSCTEVMQAYLKQIRTLNKNFNAITSLPDEGTLLKEAAVADKDLRAGRYRGWMHGFPHAVKDLADAQGLVTTAGSPLFNEVADKDDVHVARMRQAGAIFVGKTNVPEFGYGSQSYNPVFGATGCAYDATRTAGGSSGGAAAALALNMVPVADGSDMMGSLRNPGAFNNVIGFRPTPGVVPLSQGFTAELACNGPMGRNVSDTAMLLATMAGHDPAFPGSATLNPRKFAGPLARDWQGTRIGWLGDFDGYLATEPGLLALCEAALGTFRDVGCKVDSAQISYSMPELWQTWLTFRHWSARGGALPLYENPQMRAQMKPELIWEIEGGANLSGDQLSVAARARGRWHQALQQAFDQFDFLVLPTAQVFPFDKTIHWPKQINGRNMDTYHRWMEVVIPGTLGGCPVANVPAGFNPQGLPMGLQIIGPRHHDMATLQMAFAYEQASRWNLDYPPKALL